MVQNIMMINVEHGEKEVAMLKIPMKSKIEKGDEKHYTREMGVRVT